MGRFGRSVRVLREDDVRATLDMASCIEACDLAFASYSRGGAALPGVISLNIPERQGEVHVKAGHLHGAPFYAVKVASGFPRNLELGLPASDGMVIVFEGDPAAFLLDGGYLTSVRTGRGGRRGREVPGAEKVWNVAVIGTGDQAATSWTHSPSSGPGSRT
jgi:ornithine cyclodeaminase